MSIMSYRDERINFELIEYGNWEQIEIFSKLVQADTGYFSKTIAIKISKLILTLCLVSL